MPDFSDPFSIISTANKAGTLLGIGGSGTSTSIIPGFSGTTGLVSTVSAVGAKLANGTTLANGFPVIPGFQSGITNDLPLISDPMSQAAAGATAFANQFNPNNGLTTEFKKSMSPSIADSDKRLQSIRSRAAKTLYEHQGQDTYTSDRGPITRMRLLKAPDYDPTTAVKGARTNVDDDVNALLSDSGYINFFVTDLRSDFNEKSQIMMTFADNEVVYYFGRQPIIMNISGILFDSIENDWFAKFLTLYAGILRGTQLAKNFSLVELTFPNMIVTGSISGLSTNQSSQRDTDIGFSIQFIAKEVVPLPAAYQSDTPPSNISGTLIDFNANRQGVAGYTLSSGSLGNGFIDSVTKTVGSVSSTLSSLTQGLTGGLSGLVGGLTGTASGITNSLNSFRSNIFSPVFGVISSITKIVKSVTGSISNIISSFTNPVNQVLRDITSIATQASAVALLVESSVNQAISIPARTITNFNNTIASLKGASGTIARVPEDISESFRRLYGTGRIKRGAAILSSGKKKTKSKSAVLSSGSPYTPSKSNKV